MPKDESGQEYREVHDITSDMVTPLVADLDDDQYAKGITVSQDDYRKEIQAMLGDVAFLNGADTQDLLASIAIAGNRVGGVDDITAKASRDILRLKGHVVDTDMISEILDYNDIKLPAIEDINFEDYDSLDLEHDKLDGWAEQSKAIYGLHVKKNPELITFRDNVYSHIDKTAEHMKRKVGATDNAFVDFAGRLVEGGASFIDGIGLDETADFLRKHASATNPEWDEHSSSVIGNAIGQMATMMGAAVASTAAATAAVAAAVPSATVATAGLAGAAIGRGATLLSSLGMIQEEAEEKTYDATGSKGLAEAAATGTSAYAQAALETAGLVMTGVGGKVGAKLLAKAGNKSQVAKELVRNIAKADKALTKIPGYATKAGDVVVGTLGEATTEVMQGAMSDYSVGNLTNMPYQFEPFDVRSRAMDALGGAAGGLAANVSTNYILPEKVLGVPMRATEEERAAKDAGGKHVEALKEHLKKMGHPLPVDQDRVGMMEAVKQDADALFGEAKSIVTAASENTEDVRKATKDNSVAIYNSIKETLGGSLQNASVQKALDASLGLLDSTKEYGVAAYDKATKRAARTKAEEVAAEAAKAVEETAAPVTEATAEPVTEATAEPVTDAMEDVTTDAVEAATEAVIDTPDITATAENLAPEGSPIAEQTDDVLEAAADVSIIAEEGDPLEATLKKFNIIDERTDADGNRVLKMETADVQAGGGDSVVASTGKGAVVASGAAGMSVSSNTTTARKATAQYQATINKDGTVDLLRKPSNHADAKWKKIANVKDTKALDSYLTNVDAKQKKETAAANVRYSMGVDSLKEAEGITGVVFQAAKAIPAKAKEVLGLALPTFKGKVGNNTKAGKEALKYQNSPKFVADLIDLGLSPDEAVTHARNIRTAWKNAKGTNRGKLHKAVGLNVIRDLGIDYDRVDRVFYDIKDKAASEKAAEAEMTPEKELIQREEVAVETAKDFNPEVFEQVKDFLINEPREDNPVTQENRNTPEADQAAERLVRTAIAANPDFNYERFGVPALLDMFFNRANPRYFADEGKLDRLEASNAVDAIDRAQANTAPLSKEFSETSLADEGINVEGEEEVVEDVDPDAEEVAEDAKPKEPKKIAVEDMTAEQLVAAYNRGDDIMEDDSPVNELGENNIDNYEREGVENPITSLFDDIDTVDSEEWLTGPYNLLGIPLPTNRLAPVLNAVANLFLGSEGGVSIVDRQEFQNKYETEANEAAFEGGDFMYPTARATKTSIDTGAEGIKRIDTVEIDKTILRSSDLTAKAIIHELVEVAINRKSGLRSKLSKIATDMGLSEDYVDNAIREASEVMRFEPTDDPHEQLVDMFVSYFLDGFKSSEVGKTSPEFNKVLDTFFKDKEFSRLKMRKLYDAFETYNDINYDQFLAQADKFAAKARAAALESILQSGESKLTIKQVLGQLRNAVRTGITNTSGNVIELAKKLNNENLVKTFMDTANRFSHHYQVGQIQAFVIMNIKQDLVDAGIPVETIDNYFIQNKILNEWDFWEHDITQGSGVAQSIARAIADTDSLSDFLQEPMLNGETLGQFFDSVANTTTLESPKEFINNLNNMFVLMYQADPKAIGGKGAEVITNLEQDVREEYRPIIAGLFNPENTARAKHSNPNLSNRESAEVELESIRKDLGPAKYSELKKSSNDLATLINHSIDRSVAAGKLGPVTAKMFKNNSQSYVTFQLAEAVQDDPFIDGAIREQFGIGPNETIAGPLEITAMKLAAMNQSATMFEMSNLISSILYQSEEEQLRVDSVDPTVANRELEARRLNKKLEGDSELRDKASKIAMRKLLKQRTDKAKRAKSKNKAKPKPITEQQLQRATRVEMDRLREEATAKANDTTTTEEEVEVVENNTLDDVREAWNKLKGEHTGGEVGVRPIMATRAVSSTPNPWLQENGYTGHVGTVSHDNIVEIVETKDLYAEKQRLESLPANKDKSYFVTADSGDFVLHETNLPDVSNILYPGRQSHEYDGALRTANRALLIPRLAYTTLNVLFPFVNVPRAATTIHLLGMKAQGEDTLTVGNVTKSFLLAPIFGFSFNKQERKALWSSFRIARELMKSDISVDQYIKDITGDYSNVRSFGDLEQNIKYMRYLEATGRVTTTRSGEISVGSDPTEVAKVAAKFGGGVFQTATDKNIQEFMHKQQHVPGIMEKWDQRHAVGAKVRGAVMGLAKGYMDFSRDFNNMTEMAEKIAGVQMFLAQGKTLDEAGTLADKFSGNPSPTAGGKWKRILSPTMLYPTSYVQGTSNAVELLKTGLQEDNRARTARFATLGLRNALITTPAVLGGMAWVISKAFGASDEEAEKDKEIAERLVQNIPEQDRKSGMSIPICFRDPRSGELILPQNVTEIDPSWTTVYVKAPYDHISAIGTGLIGDFVDSVGEGVALDSMVAGMFTSSLGAVLPGMSPIMSTVQQALDFGRGRNPTDAFTGKQVINSSTFEQGGAQVAADYAMYLLNQYVPFIPNFSKGGPSDKSKWNEPINNEFAKKITRLMGAGIIKESAYGQVQKSLRDTAVIKEAKDRIYKDYPQDVANTLFRKKELEREARARLAQLKYDTRKKGQDPDKLKVMSIDLLTAEQQDELRQLKLWHKTHIKPLKEYAEIAYVSGDKDTYSEIMADMTGYQGE